MESGIGLLAKPLFRNGPITCAGHLFSCFSRQINRLCRSSVSSECVDISTVIDLSLRMRAVIIEIYHGEFRHQPTTSPDPLMLRNPFRVSGEFGKTHEKNGRTDKNTLQPLDLSRTDHQRFMINCENDSICFTPHCKSRGVGSILHLSDIRPIYSMRLNPPVEEMLHTVILTDCSNCFSAVMNIGAKCTDKTTQLHMAYIRDSHHLITLRYICGVFNIADVGAKKYCQVALYRRLARFGKFGI